MYILMGWQWPRWEEILETGATQEIVVWREIPEDQEEKYGTKILDKFHFASKIDTLTMAHNNSIPHTIVLIRIAPVFDLAVSCDENRHTRVACDK